MAKALVAGGVRVLEVTLRTACALDAIRAIAQEVPEAIVGAGTVTNVEQLKAVTEAGAQFAISPGLTESLLKAATEEGSIPLIPGISTVSELMLGMQYGLKEFKFFPAEANGGVKALQAIGGPFAHIRFCPTGGISPANYRDLPGTEQRAVHRRFLAGSGGCAGSGRLRPYYQNCSRSG
ncbi:KHG/KDPG aldolase [Raoultella planticola]|uniref:2-dehydro-3-deoxy-phosphogluconate aldolase n=1 Tax=Raoultella planticola TaxID=575 RepID=A0A485ARL9_RAOPL|nr:KHG/KDPG aldolase [Raoultella planticola]